MADENTVEQNESSSVEQDNSKDSSTENEFKVSKEEYEGLTKELNDLKEFHKTIMKEKKIEEDKRKQAQKEKLEKEGDFKNILEAERKEFQAALKERDEKLSQWEQRNRDDKLNRTAEELASSLAKTSTKRARDLARNLKDYLKYTEDGVKVTDGKGNIVSGDLKSLSDFAKKEFDHLCDGVDSSGGAGIKVLQKPETLNNQNNLDVVDKLNAAFGLKN